MSISYQIEQKHSLRQVVAIAYTPEKRLLTTVIFNGLHVVTFQTVRKFVHSLVYMCPLAISREERNKELFSTRSKFRFPYVDI